MRKTKGLLLTLKHVLCIQLLTNLSFALSLQLVIGIETKEEAAANEKNPPLFKRFLKFMSVIHNLILFVWSVGMFVGISIAAYERYLANNGDFFTALICSASERPLTGPFSFWIFVFHLSKYYEFVDTIILVLSRKRLIVLHVFHHGIMVCLTWYWLFDNWLTGSWYCVFINSFIHTFMYFYYMLTSLGFKPQWKKLLTTAQIVQLVSGFILVTWWLLKCEEWKCTTGYWAGFFSNASNGLLIVLFIRFFFFTYSGEEGGKQKKTGASAVDTKKDN